MNSYKGYPHLEHWYMYTCICMLLWMLHCFVVRCTTYVHTHTHYFLLLNLSQIQNTHTHSKTFKKLTGVYDGQIRSGRTAVDMPALQLAALQKSVMASCTGPYGGLCQLDPEKDSPTHDRGVQYSLIIFFLLMEYIL